MSLIYGIAGRYHITVPVAAYNIINTTQQLFYSIIVICKTSVIIISITRRNRAYITIRIVADDFLSFLISLAGGYCRQHEAGTYQHNKCF